MDENLRKKKKKCTDALASISFLAQRRSEQAISMRVGIARSHGAFSIVTK